MVCSLLLLNIAIYYTIQFFMLASNEINSVPSGTLHYFPHVRKVLCIETENTEPPSESQHYKSFLQTFGTSPAHTTTAQNGKNIRAPSQQHISILFFCSIVFLRRAQKLAAPKHTETCYYVGSVCICCLYTTGISAGIPYHRHSYRCGKVNK